MINQRTIICFIQIRLSELLRLNTRFEKSHLLIYDLSGNLIRKENYQEHLDLGNLAEGIYVIHLINNDGTYFMNKVIRD